jgi:flagellar hook-length control protein FliK
MKVTSDPGSAPPPSRSGESQTSEPKTFEKVLERKNVDRHEKKLRGQKRSGRETEAQDGLPAAAMPFAPLRQAEPPEVGKAAPASEIRTLDGLVREILVEAGPGVDPKVEVQFHSKTLEGLNVRISRKGDEISIRFLTGSDSVAQLLSRNTEQLSQSLLAKGLHVAPIQVERSAASLSPEAGRSPGDGRRGQGSERQDKRQR